MRWPIFLFWNALGGIALATSVGLAAYYLGPAAEHIVKVAGIAGIGVAVLIAEAYLMWRRLATSGRPSTNPAERPLRR